MTETGGANHIGGEHGKAPEQQFASDGLAQNAVAEEAAALALLDAIEADSVRRAAAIAAIPP
jgi:hypothetical protein